MTKCIAFFTNPQKAEAKAVRTDSIRIARQMGFACHEIAPNQPVESLPEDTAFLVAIGGDGTILKAIPYACARDIPILGINLGRVGFLSELLPNEFAHALEAYLQARLLLESRMMLSCQVNGKEAAVCLNDVLLYKENFSGVAHIQMNIDGDFAGSIFCDGMIVSTPTGATGYSISAGGPIIAPGIDTCTITPVCPHSLLVRPIVTAPTADIRFRMQSAGCLYADGQKIMNVGNDDTIMVTGSDKQARFLRRAKHNLYQLIKEKLI